MKEIKLSDIFPTKPEVVIDGKTYTIRPPNLFDLSWIDKTFGGPEQVSAILTSQNWPKIACLAYHLLEDKAKIQFKARTAKIINETTGDEVDQHLSGPEVLLTHIHGVEGGIKLLGAICKAIADSNPMVDEVVKKLMADANKAEKAPPRPAKPIGRESSTNSKLPTGGKRSTSARKR